MPFDYESFMQGVITGLKLGRTPNGRTPPVPSEPEPEPESNPEANESESE